jgi:hypothetical protein
MRRIWLEFLASIAASLFGLYLLFRAIRNDNLFADGTIKVPAWLLIIGGILIQIPLIFLISQLPLFEEFFKFR